MLLRPYQTAALAGVQSVYRSGARRALLVAPTGAGKSAMMRHMLGRTEKRTLILCHRAELLDMISGSLPVPHDVIAGGGRVRERVQVGMMQTVSRRLDALPSYEWVISDEAHLAMCATWRSILQHYSTAWHLGLSATPCRLDGIGLGAEYEKIVYGPTIRELTEQGYLVPARVFAPVVAEFKQRGRSSLAQEAEALDRAGITGDVIEHWKRIASDRLTLVFASSREHAEHVAEAFRAAGIPSAAVDGSMPKAIREPRIKAFERGELRVLVNVELLTTGYDNPKIGALVFLRRTESLALFLQMIGRGLRLAPGKSDCLVLDHVGNTFIHGMPDDDREWTLDGRLQRKAAIAVAQCPTCYAAHRPAPRCPACNHVYAAAPKPKGRKIEEREGVLEEVDGAGLEQLGGRKLHVALKEARGKPTDHEARTALFEVARAMGYKPGWVTTQMEIRRKFKLGAGMRERRAEGAAA